MASASPWAITQLGGDRKVIILKGWSAPFGRPRKGSLVEDGVELREAETYYDGDDSGPTRHIFGTRNADWELNGRFRDVEEGKGGARAMVQKLKAFLRDGQECSIEWAGNVFAVGLMTKFTPGRESASEITWKIVFKISRDDSTAVVARPAVASSAGELAARIADSLKSATKFPPKIGVTIDFDTGFLDSIDDAISELNGVLGSFVNLANSISNLERASFNTISRLRASIGQVNTAALILEQTVASFSNDAALARDSSASTLAFSSLRASNLSDMYAARALLADADRQAEASQRGQATSSYRVQAGDTWESISIAVYGGPSGADKIRRANGARYGTKPAAGSTVQIPIAI